jgi:hypothetical protein
MLTVGSPGMAFGAPGMPAGSDGEEDHDDSYGDGDSDGEEVLPSEQEIRCYADEVLEMDLGRDR